MYYDAGLALLTEQVIGVCEENDNSRLKAVSVVQTDMSCVRRSSLYGIFWNYTETRSV